MKRTRITTDGPRVTVREWDDYYGWVSTTYRARPGGYVYDQDGRQPCVGLRSTGDTLMWTHGTLGDLIRREYRRGRRVDRDARNARI